MHIYEWLFLIINIAVLGIVILGLVEYWAFAVSILLLMVVIIIQRMEVKIGFRNVAHINKRRKEQINSMISRIDMFAHYIEGIKNSIHKSMFAIESRFSMKVDSEKDGVEKNYREIARKILDVENRLNKTKKTLATALGAMDERLTHVERREEGKY